MNSDRVSVVRAGVNRTHALQALRASAAHLGSVKGKTIVTHRPLSTVLMVSHG